ncbi:hypothetical protein SCOCK_720029 [Actinacidiphila cocklensis]|uniref:Uncharacterized protein n=1 Tax=Actinacidiphila cocklensis TaxID=887465 RepID=A0A9W4GW68_9ACTN|nr:hypothetical protein SCOCK_720029 [Actinacidiphila cocklensis]
MAGTDVPDGGWGADRRGLVPRLAAESMGQQVLHRRSDRLRGRGDQMRGTDRPVRFGEATGIRPNCCDGARRADSS